MDNNSTSDPHDLDLQIQKAFANLQTLMPPQRCQMIRDFYEGYCIALQETKASCHVFYTFLQLLLQECRHPSSFEPYHIKIKAPFNYYKFGLDFIRPLIDIDRSCLLGIEQLDIILELLTQGDNIILLANHQTEPDPQILSILLEPLYGSLASSIIYVAGERVITDPLAVPFSLGCNLLCIYSKRYIDNPPELKEDKQLHNQKTMARMSELLAQGSQTIYVAPSGGRDRKNQHGRIEVAPFDPDSLEMFCLMAKKSKRTTHFFPLALLTYPLLPPPAFIQTELGEIRKAKRTPVFAHFLPEYPMELAKEGDKKLKRQERATRLWNIVSKAHEELLKLL
jgi:glycerol-3-phosphate O-acyltransferase